MNLKYSISLFLLYCSSVLAQPTDLDCLTANIFMEARGESLRGKRAVADVTINRSKHSAFVNQSTVCEVVFARGQFSWVKQQPKKATQKILSGDLRGLKDKDVLAYQLSHKIAVEALNNEPASRLPSSVVSFHNTRVNPNWNMKRYGVVGNHVFYSFRGNKV